MMAKMVYAPKEAWKGTSANLVPKGFHIKMYTDLSYIYSFNDMYCFTRFRHRFCV